ncbi:hypothetical protein VTO73DRAFT_4585 [Trametes versicolor]
MQSQATQADADAGATQTLDSREAVEPKQSDAVSDLLAVEGEADLLGALEGKPTAATPQTAAEAVPRPDGVEDAAKLSPEGCQPARTPSKKRIPNWDPRRAAALVASANEIPSILSEPD